MRAKNANPSRKRAIGYSRCSTSEQADFGVSLEAQAEKIRHWCAANDYELHGILTDRGISGGRSDNRPALQEALATLEPGDSLVVYSLSRLARSTKDTLAIAEVLEGKGADLVSLTERLDTTTSSGLLAFRMLAVLSEFERDLIAERTKLAMRHLRSKGRFLGGSAPFGYRCEGGYLREVPEEMEIVQMIRSLREEGMSLRAISRQLFSVGIAARSGSPFVPIQLVRILKSASVFSIVALGSGDSHV
jgi:DNA invertase Pin-like site-specific DNA recombinase